MGQEDLTPRELEVLELIREGNKNKQIADQLSISETTVNFHIKNIVDKLQANDQDARGHDRVTAGSAPDLSHLSTGTDLESEVCHSDQNDVATSSGLLAAAVCCSLAPPRAQSVEPTTRLTQYAHRAWRTGDAGLMGTPQSSRSNEGRVHLGQY